ncbi:DUF4405 domain-containing protein [Parablautia intestinalis]|uniref:DUF4405 domain-containing protein n=1 Tax=Parablautia intestinalis TaxID=2320100 RepID=A0A3A9A5G8_9FIRM|nr:DUF4405 domain-containing protein [Parablautia intestinalis]RKI86970.1 DUF4405 domain-containing protein [Parablautia intestinalis]
MKQKTILKIIIDIGMTVVLLFLMAYELIGEAAHEWLGIGMLVLFIIHHSLNWKWSRSVFKGKYIPLRIWQTVFVIGILLTIAGSMYSGVILSKHALSFMPIKGGRALAREIHMVSAYCGFVLMSLHLGFHWKMMMGMASRIIKELPSAGRWMLRGIAALAAGYGVYAFIRRKIGHYMFLQNQYVFFDFKEPLIFFLADYVAVMALFVWVSHYFSKGLGHIIQKRKII